MSDMSDRKSAVCGEALERTRYFPRQLLTADDMRLEQEYFREKLRRHNRYLHGWGVVCGCEVRPLPGSGTSMVRVCPGYAVSPQGDEILVDGCRDIDLKVGDTTDPCTVRWPCPPPGEMPGDKRQSTTVYIAVRYAECMSRPVRVHPAGCGCDELSCEYSRIRDSFEIKVLWQLPASHAAAAAHDDAWCNLLRGKPGKEDPGRRHLFPVPPCPECVPEPWVVLATVAFPAPSTTTTAGSTTEPQISYKDRRVLLSTHHVQIATLCLP